MKDKVTGKWYGTPENLFYEGKHYATTRKIPFNVANFFWDFYEVAQRVNGYVMGYIREWDKLVVKGLDCLMPFVLKRAKSNKIYVQINYDIDFFTCPFGLKSIKRTDRKGYLLNCSIIDYNYKLTDDDQKPLAAIYPNFCLTYLSKWVCK